MDAETYLRLLAEEVIAGAGRPALEVVDALDGLGAAALALAGAGLVATATAADLLGETSDALVLRGVDWLVHGFPDSGVAALHEASATVRGSLRRVVAVAAGVDGGDGQRRTVTSLEVFADQGLVRLVDGDGATDTWCFSPPPEPADRHLILHLIPGAPVRVALDRGVDVRTWDARRRPVAPAVYLERLVWQQLALVRRDPTAEGMTRARRRVHEAETALAGVGDAGAVRPGPVVAAFDATLVEATLVEAGPVEADGGVPAAPQTWLRIVAPPAAGTALERVVPIAGRLLEAAGGWEVASLEVWGDHWRLVTVGAPHGPWCVWSAVDEGGCVYGGAPAGSDVVRFDPALAPGWTAVTVSLLDAGHVVELEVRE